MTTRVIIPTYNERENIIRLSEEILTSTPDDVRITVIDDSSPDGTASAVAEYAKTEPRIEVITRAGKFGMGSAYREAFRNILARGEDECVVTMDADFSHNPRYLPGLIAACGSHDLVVGSRYVTGGAIEHWERWRRLLSWGGNRYVRLITGLPIRDCTAGFSAMRADFLRNVPFDAITASGYAWWFTLRMLFFRRGGRITEIPITFTERRVGQSKINTHIIYEGLIEPWRIRFSKLR